VACALAVIRGGRATATVCRVMKVSRSQVCALKARPSDWKDGRGRPAIDEEEVRLQIKDLVVQRPTYGYPRITGLLNRIRRAQAVAPINEKRVYRIMGQCSWLLRRAPIGPQPRHEGKVAVTQSDRRYCSDGFEIGCDNGEKVRVTFSLDCCDREAIAFVASTGGYTGEIVRDVMLATLQARFGKADRAPHEIQWLTDNGSGYIAHETRRFARELGFTPKTTSPRSPQSNGMAESFVNTFRRDYVRIKPTPDARTVLASLPEWFEDYNEVHPHQALKMRSPREFRNVQFVSHSPCPAL